MGSLTGIAMALVVLAATAFVFVQGQPGESGLVWAESPVEETVIASTAD